jgi:hypothetical protein
MATSRYQRDQRIARAGTIVFVTVLTVVTVWALHRSYAQQADPPDDGAASVDMSTVPMDEGAWLTGTEPSIDNLVTARNHIAAAAARHDLAATGAACASATGAVANLHQQLPSPEPVVNHSLQQAISNYDVGLPICISATQTVNRAGMVQAATYISQGDAAMRVALDLIENGSGAATRNLPMLIV